MSRQKKPPVEPKLGELYYCKSRQAILRADKAFFGGNYEFSFLMEARAPILLHPTHFQYLVHLPNEMAVIACVTRITDRQERGRARR